MEKIIVKQISDPDNPGVNFKHPNSKEFLASRAGEDGKLITGFDENALHILLMEDATAKAALQKKIKTKRAEIEKLLGIDLGVNSDYWSDFFIVIEDDLILDTQNPRDQLVEWWLIANRYVAPSEDALENDERFHGCIYYMHRETDVAARKVESQLNRDKAIARIITLRESDPNKLILVVSNLLGYSSESSLTCDQAYIKAKEYLNQDDIIKGNRGKNTRAFLEALEKSSEELMTKLILDKAIKKKIVTTRNKIHRRGDQVYGNNYEEALEYLSAIESSGELNSLKKEVERI